MKWFQHDSDASHDAKIKKLILRHGAIGYAVYFHCLELIAGTITQTNINFELEHDSEIIADNLKITGDSNTAGIDKVNRIMKTIIQLGLFTMQNNRVFCYKMASRLDNTVSRSPEINKIKQLRSDYVEDTKTYGAEENRIEYNTLDDNKKEKKISNKDYININEIFNITDIDNIFLTNNQYTKLRETYTDSQIKDKVITLSNYMYSAGKKYKSHYHTILNWFRRDKDKQPSNQPGRVKEGVPGPCRG